MKKLFKIFAWISIACGLIAYSIGWIALFANSVFWNIPTEFWFYDAIATAMFGVFFLMYSVHSKK